MMSRNSSPREIKVGPAHCWVVVWTEDDRYPFTKNFLHVLPYRWSQSRVLDYLLGLCHNTALEIFERRSWMNSRTKTGMIVHKDGSGITVGGHPYLLAWRVKDFRSVYNPESQVEIVTFTRLARMRLNRQTGLLEVQEPASEFSLKLKH